MSECLIVSLKSPGKTVHLDAGSTSNGTRIHLWDKLSANHRDYLNQVWLWDGKVFRSAKNRNKSLRLDGQRTTCGTKIHLWDIVEGSHQEWVQDGENIVSKKVPSRCWHLDCGNTGNGTKIHIWALKNHVNGKWKIEYLEKKKAEKVTWTIVSVGYDAVIGVPSGAKKIRTITVGLESETKESENNLSWDFTEDKWGVSAEVTAEATWGWGNVKGTAGYKDHKTQKFVQNVKDHFKRKFRKVQTTNTTEYVGPCYVHQAYITLKGSDGTVRAVRSEFYIRTTKDPNETFDTYIDMKRF